MPTIRQAVAASITVSVSLVGSAVAVSQPAAASPSHVRHVELIYRSAVDPGSAEAFLAVAAPQLASDWGVSLDEARARLGRQDSQNAFLAKLQSSDAAHYGGGYIDQAHGGVLVVNETDDGTAAQSLAVTMGLQGKLQTEHARATFTALQGIANSVNNQLGGQAVVDATVDPTGGGRVAVALKRSAAGAAPSAQVRQSLDALATQYGAELVIRPDEDQPRPLGCNLMRCDNPLRGGQRWQVGGTLCTAGFNVWNTSFTHYYMMTAGHCLTNNVGQTAFAQNTGGGNVNIGKAAYQYGVVGTLDIVLVDYSAGNWTPQSGVLVMTSQGGKNTTYSENYAVTAPPGPASNGSYLCHTGISVGTSCGTVGNQPVGPYGAVTVAAVTCEGDSGGPWYANGHAYGIMSTGLGSATYPQTSASDPSHNILCFLSGQNIYIGTALSGTATVLM